MNEQRKDTKTTLDELIRAVLKYMDEKGMLEDLKEKYPTKVGGCDDQN